MFRTLEITIITLAVLGTACSGGRATEEAREGAVAKNIDTASARVADTTSAAFTDTYRSLHDPDAFYTRDNITFTGSYLKVDMDDLTPDQFNRVIHRLKTEKSTCGSGKTIDECLVSRPWCWVAVELLKQVVREEKFKG